MKQKHISRNLALLLSAAFLAFPFFSDGYFAAHRNAEQKKTDHKKDSARVIELRNIEQLKEAFQRDAGKVRLLTILSPT